MTLVCATDFSPASDKACDVAAALAKKTKAPLVLVHALSPGADSGEAAAALNRICERLRKRGADVIERIEAGDPHDVIVRAAAETDARLIALAPASDLHRSLLGSTTDRTLSDSPVPVLALREGFPVDEWLAGSRALRVAAAIDLSPISDAAASWVATLDAYGPVERTALHVEWPVDAYERLDIESPMPLDRTHPVVEELVQREMDAATRRMSRNGEPVDVIVESPSAPPAEALARMAESARADLLVIGHRPSREWRIWKGSVARATLRSAPMSVACVPDIDVPLAVEPRAVRCIVAATDLSPHGNEAVAYALAIAPPGARVFIVHVFERLLMTPQERERVVDGLSTFAARRDLIERRIEARVEMIESERPAKAIADFADRQSADIVCIAGRGRSRLPRLMLGSVAQELLLLSQRAVLVAP